MDLRRNAASVSGHEDPRRSLLFSQQDSSFPGLNSSPPPGRRPKSHRENRIRKVLGVELVDCSGRPLEPVFEPYTYLVNHDQQKINSYSIFFQKVADPALRVAICWKIFRPLRYSIKDMVSILSTHRSTFFRWRKEAEGKKWIAA